jgi:hypothetical protein
LQSGVGRLQRAAAKLKEKWLEAKSHWRDQASRDFEKRHLQPLAPEITQAVAAVHEFADVLAQVERELEDPDAPQGF